MDLIACANKERMSAPKKLLNAAYLAELTPQAELS